MLTLLLNRSSHSRWCACFCLTSHRLYLGIRSGLWDHFYLWEYPYRPPKASKKNLLPKNKQSRSIFPFPEIHSGHRRQARGLLGSLDPIWWKHCSRCEPHWVALEPKGGRWGWLGWPDSCNFPPHLCQIRESIEQDNDLGEQCPEILWRNIPAPLHCWQMPSFPDQEQRMCPLQLFGPIPLVGTSYTCREDVKKNSLDTPLGKGSKTPVTEKFR